MDDTIDDASLRDLRLVMFERAKKQNNIAYSNLRPILPSGG